MLQSSILIVLGVVPISLFIAALASFDIIALLSIPGGRWIQLVFIARLMVPFESLHYSPLLSNEGALACSTRDGQ